VPPVPLLTPVSPVKTPKTDNYPDASVLKANLMTMELANLTLFVLKCYSMITLMPRTVENVTFLVKSVPKKNIANVTPTVTETVHKKT